MWCLLDVPHLARLSRLCRGRPRPCPRRLLATGVFSFFVKNILRSMFRSQASIHTYRYIPISVYVHKKFGWVACRSLSLDLGVRGSNPGCRILLCAPFSLFCSSVNICTMMIEVSSEQSRSQIYMHTECCCRCCCCCSVLQYC